MPTAFDDSILKSLRRISRAIDIHSRRLAVDYKLTSPQLMCLRTLSASQKMTSGGLAAAVDLSQATVTGILDRLEARELITRTRDPKDKRRVLVGITAAGRKLIAAAPVPLQRKFADRLAALSEAEQANIDAVLQKIVQMMSAEDLDAAPLMGAGPASVAPGEVVEFLTPEPGDPSDR